MRIDSLYLKDIGPFEEVTIDFPAGTNPELADVYLLTGENGCGKSTVLYAIASLLRRADESRCSERMTFAERAGDGCSAGGNARRSACPGRPWAFHVQGPAPHFNAVQSLGGVCLRRNAKPVERAHPRAARELEVDALENCLSFHGTANSPAPCAVARRSELQTASLAKEAE
jgi:ABC-type dipeptide/oligopeptide/nickel transport system ATPase component